MRLGASTFQPSGILCRRARILSTSRERVTTRRLHCTSLTACKDGIGFNTKHLAIPGLLSSLFQRDRIAEANRRSVNNHNHQFIFHFSDDAREGSLPAASWMLQSVGILFLQFGGHRNIGAQ